MMAMKNVVIGVLACIAVVTCAFVYWCARVREYEACCAFAYSDRDIHTNSVGWVIQPETRMGTYVDFRLVAKEDFSRLISGCGDVCRFEDRCNSEMSKCNAESNMVCKACSSLVCNVSGQEVAIVELKLTSPSREVAKKVLVFAVDAFRQMADEDNKRQDRKALAQIEANVQKGRRKGKDVSALERQRGKICEELKKRHKRLFMLDEVSVSR